MKTIGEVIQAIIEKMSDRNGYKRAWLEKHWEQLVGDEAAKHSRPYRIDREQLIVSVDSSVWNQELFMKKANLIAKINREFARKIVVEVKFQIGCFTSACEVAEPPDGTLSLGDGGEERSGSYSWDKNVINSLQKKTGNFPAGKK